MSLDKTINVLEQLGHVKDKEIVKDENGEVLFMAMTLEPPKVKSHDYTYENKYDYDDEQVNKLRKQEEEDEVTNKSTTDSDD